MAAPQFYWSVLSKTAAGILTLINYFAAIALDKNVLVDLNAKLNKVGF